MYPSKDARELAILLRISRELDIVGDMTATVDNPSELLAWALILSRPDILAWRATDSGHRYLHATARHKRPPIRGHITAVLPCDQHPDYWNALDLNQLAPGNRHQLNVDALSDAWAIMPITSPQTDQPAAPQPPEEQST
jgi:hypothetical protein